MNYWVVIIKMRYLVKPKFRKYVTGYGFLLFAKKFGNRYGKKLMDAATKTGIDAAKNTSKRIVQKTAEATGREKMYEGREKIIEGFKNEIFPLYYDKEDEEKWSFKKRRKMKKMKNKWSLKKKKKKKSI